MAPSRRSLLVSLAASSAYGAKPKKRPTFTLVVIVTGPPGSGKTTQAQRLSRKYNIPALSVPEILAAKFGKKAPASLQAGIASGTLVNDHAANQLMEARLLRADAGSGFILDGYPVSEGQARFLDQVIQNQNLPAPKVILLDAPDEVVRQRMLARKQADDLPEMIEERLKEFHDESGFLSRWYKPDNTIRVDGTQVVEAVETQIDAGLEDSLMKRGLTAR